MTALQYFVQKLNNTNADVQCAYTPKIIVALPPITPHITSAVRMPAPTLSPVVITICASCDESVLLSDPALASPELVPVPLTSLFHPGAWSTRLLCIASSTAICSPLQSTLSTSTSCRASLHCGHGRRLDLLDNIVVRPGSELCSCRLFADKVCLERTLIDVTFSGRLAGLVQDSVLVELLRGSDKGLGS